MAPKFTVDLEDWNHGLHCHNQGHDNVREVRFILELLDKFDLKAIFYVLGRFSVEHGDVVRDIKERGHTIKSHGYWHDWGEPADRYPYFSNKRFPPLSGGFFFRLFPLWLTKIAIKRTGFLFIHPHDLDEDHPRCRNFLYNIKRHIGLKTAKVKLGRLLEEVEFESP